MSELHKLYNLTKVMHHDVYPSISPTNPNLAVTGQTVLITGGGRGIGLSTAKAFAQAGASTIIIVGRTQSTLEKGREEILKLATAAEIKVLTFTADVASKTSVSALWDKVEAAKLRVDVLINNAGISSGHVVIGQTNPDDWWKVQEVNLFGPYLMTYGYITQLDKHGDTNRATVIHVSSQIGVSSFPGSSAYAVAKIGLMKFSDMINTEYPNIRSFAIHPGIIFTDMAVGSPIGKHAIDKVELAAGSMLYLASPRADFLRGRYTTANWDVDELEAHKDQILASETLKVGLIIGQDEVGYKW